MPHEPSLYSMNVIQLSIGQTLKFYDIVLDKLVALWYTNVGGHGEAWPGRAGYGVAR